MVLWQSSESKLECYRTKSRRCYTQRFCQSSRCTGYRSRKHDRFFCRPVKFRQDRRFLEENTCIQKDDFTGAFLQAGVSELTMALLLPGYGTSRRCDCCMRYLLRILRLHETRHTYGCLDGTSRQIHLDTRRIPCR